MLNEYDWRIAVIPPDADLQRAMQIIDQAGIQFGVVVDGDDRLLGIVSDGVVRRVVLGGASLKTPIAEVMNPHPVVADESAADNSAREKIMRAHGVFHLPMVDVNGRITRLFALLNYGVMWQSSSEVVIMAGGRGSRMKDLTRGCPKPMLRLNQRPILEVILGEMLKHGFKRFHLSVNYLADQIIDHFGDGSGFGAEISYLRESTRLGTAGPLSLLTERPRKPLVVVNGDVLVNAPWRDMLAAHSAGNAMATIGVAPYRTQIPYGVVDTDDKGEVVGFREKPCFSWLINAGVYVLSPQALDFVPRNRYFDMPDLFAALTERKNRIKVFRLDSYWLDIGRPEDYTKAMRDIQDMDDCSTGGR